MTTGKRPSVRLSREEVWRFLADAHIGMFTTLRSDGVPVSLPVWFAALGEAIYISTPARAKKLLRVRRDPRCAFAVESGERWSELCGVSMTGTALVLAEDAPMATAGFEAIEAKYAAFRTARSEMPKATSDAYDRRGQFVVVRFEPDERILSWDNSRLGS